MSSSSGRSSRYFGENYRLPRTGNGDLPYALGQEQTPSSSMTEAPLRLYIAEEQQILREAYKAFFSSHPRFDVLGASADTSAEDLIAVDAALHPTVMLLGFKILQEATVEKLNRVRGSNPDVAIAVLSAYYDVRGIKALREFSRGAAVGCAYLLKHTIDTVDQLTQVVLSVAEGRVILDPIVMEGLITSMDRKQSFLKDLSPREMEVLGWMAKGYNNRTIGDVLCIEQKTIERHINGIYNKLGADTDSRHARVHAITTYLKAVGLLPAEDFAEE